MEQDVREAGFMLIIGIALVTMFGFALWMDTLKHKRFRVTLQPEDLCRVLLDDYWYWGIIISVERNASGTPTSARIFVDSLQRLIERDIDEIYKA